MTLSHLFLTSTTFSHDSSFTNIPTPPILSSFPHHHSLYLLLLTPKKASSFTSSSHFLQTTYPPFAFSVLRTPPFLNHIYCLHSSFQILLQSVFPLSHYESFTRRFLAPPAHLRAAGDWGPKFFFASS